MYCVLLETKESRLIMQAVDLEYTFKSGQKGLHSLNFSAIRATGWCDGRQQQEKSTLLSVLNGTAKPSSGKLLINGADVYATRNNSKVIGNIPAGWFADWRAQCLSEFVLQYKNLFYGWSFWSEISQKVLHTRFTRADGDQRSEGGESTEQNDQRRSAQTFEHCSRTGSWAGNFVLWTNLHPVCHQGCGKCNGFAQAVGADRKACVCCHSSAQFWYIQNVWQAVAARYWGYPIFFGNPFRLTYLFQKAGESCRCWRKRNVRHAEILIRNNCSTLLN